MYPEATWEREDGLVDAGPVVQRMMTDARERFADKFRADPSTLETAAGDEVLEEYAKDGLQDSDSSRSSIPTLTAPPPADAARAVKELYTPDQVDMKPTSSKRVRKPVQQMGMALVSAITPTSVAARANFLAYREWVRGDAYSQLVLSVQQRSGDVH